MLSYHITHIHTQHITVNHKAACKLSCLLGLLQTERWAKIKRCGGNGKMLLSIMEAEVEVCCKTATIASLSKNVLCNTLPSNNLFLFLHSPLTFKWKKYSVQLKGLHTYLLFLSVLMKFLFVLLSLHSLCLSLSLSLMGQHGSCFFFFPHRTDLKTLNQPFKNQINPRYNTHSLTAYRGKLSCNVSG